MSYGSLSQFNLQDAHYKLSGGTLRLSYAAGAIFWHCKTSDRCDRLSLTQKWLVHSLGWKKAWE